MKLLILKLIIVLSLNIDGGEIGRYEIELKTKTGEALNVYYNIATLDGLKSNFSSDYDFDTFFYNISEVKIIDSLTFYKDFHFINYPKESLRYEKKLYATLEEDLITVSKSDIESIKFKSFQMLEFTWLITRLNLNEIKLLQSKPVFSGIYSIDPYQEDYSYLSILSYNEKINTEVLNEMVNDFKLKYERKTTKGKHNENSWIYRKMINQWQKELKKQNVFLLEISSV